MSNPNDHPLNIDRVDPRLIVPSAAPRGTHGAWETGTPVQAPVRPDQSMTVPPVDGPGGSRGYGPVPTILDGNAPLRVTPGVPDWPAPALSPATPRDPNPGTRMGSHAQGAQAMLNAYRAAMDPAFSTTDDRDALQGLGNPFKDPRVITPVRR